RGGSSDRRRRHREPARPDRARSRPRSGRDPPSQSRATRGSAVELADRQRVRQRLLPGCARAAARGRALRRAPARAGEGARRGTWASRGMPIGGSATLLAARALAQKIRAVAGVLLEVHPDDIALAEARASVRGAPGRALGYAELARIVHFRSNALKGLEPSLE